MKRFPVHALLLAICLLPLSATALELPVAAPEGMYSDPDPSAMAFSPRPGGRAQFRQRLDAAIQNNPRNVLALSQRAYMFMEGGDLEHAKRDFNRALAAAEPGTQYERHVLWSRGWASYELGDYPAALADWERAIALHGGRPFWAAYTMALLYWTTGQQEVALQWYDTAVAADPKWWSNAEGLAERTDHWSPPQQARVQALFARWSDTRPALGEAGAPAAP